MFSCKTITEPSSIKTFREKFSFDERARESQSILNKYPGRIPVIIELRGSSKYTLIHKKYLVEKSMLLSSLAYMIRHRMEVPPESSLFFMCRNNIPRFNDSMFTIYQQYKGKDGFLVIDVREENTFGGMVVH